VNALSGEKCAAARWQRRRRVAHGRRSRRSRRACCSDRSAAPQRHRPIFPAPPPTFESAANSAITSRTHVTENGQGIEKAAKRYACSGDFEEGNRLPIAASQQRAVGGNGRRRQIPSRLRATRIDALYKWIFSRESIGIVHRHRCAPETVRRLPQYHPIHSTNRNTEISEDNTKEEMRECVRMTTLQRRRAARHRDDADIEVTPLALQSKHTTHTYTHPTAINSTFSNETDRHTQSLSLSLSLTHTHTHTHSLSLSLSLLLTQKVTPLPSGA
jgi:hypothetical protein